MVLDAPPPLRSGPTSKIITLLEDYFFCPESTAEARLNSHFLFLIFIVKQSAIMENEATPLL